MISGSMIATGGLKRFANGGDAHFAAIFGTNAARGMIIQMKSFVCALAISALTLFGADVTGKWSGTFETTREGEKHSAGAYAVLKQEGLKITGTVGPTAEQQFTIKTGNIDGNHVTLEVAPDQGPSLVKFDLTLDGDDHLAGELNGEGDGGTFKGKIDLKRDK